MSPLGAFPARSRRAGRNVARDAHGRGASRKGFAHARRERHRSAFVGNYVPNDAGHRWNPAAHRSSISHVRVRRSARGAGQRMPPRPNARATSSRALRFRSPFRAQCGATRAVAPERSRRAPACAPLPIAVPCAARSYACCRSRAIAARASLRSAPDRRSVRSAELRVLSLSKARCRGASSPALRFRAPGGANQARDVRANQT